MTEPARVLLISSRSDMRARLRAALEAAGFGVDEASDPEAPWPATEQDRTGRVIDIAGHREADRYLRTWIGEIVRRASGPVIVAADDGWAAAEALAGGAADYVRTDQLDPVRLQHAIKRAFTRGQTVESDSVPTATDDRRALALQHLMLEASRLLSSSLDVAATLTALTRLAVPMLADWCVVDLIDDDGSLGRLAIAHRDPARAADAERLRTVYPRLTRDHGHTIWQLLERGKVFLDPAVDQERFVAQARDGEHLALLRRLGYAAEMVVPLVAHGRSLGSLTLVLENRERRFGAADAELAEKLGIWAGLAIENARLYTEARAAEVFYRSLIAGTVDGVAVSDESGQYLQINAAVERMSGYSLAELQALRAAGGSISAADPTTVASAWEHLREHGHWSGTWTIRRKEGSTVPLDATVTRVPAPGRAVYIGVWRDATQRMELERLQRDVFAMVAHDLRSPLAAARAYAQIMLRRGEYREATVRELLAVLDRMARLIGDLADVVRLDNGQIALHRAPVDLRAIARQVADALPPESRERVTIEAPEEPVAGAWDADRVAQVLQNLVGNALIHAPESDVRVRIIADGGDARVAVVDRGPGIPPESMPLLFTRFSRPSSRRAGGLGLGLYIARMLVDAHGGTIWAESTPGAGNSFWFTLPRGE